MKKNRGAQKRENRGFARRTLAMFALALCLCLAVPALDGQALAVPQDGSILPQGATGLGLSDECSLQLNFPSDMAEDMDLKAEETLVDLYCIARAVHIPGYDAYAYCMDDALGEDYYNAVKDYLQQNRNFNTQELQSDPVGDAAVNPGAKKWLVFYYTVNDPERAPASDWTGLVDLLSERIFGGASPLAPVKEPGEEEPRDGSVAKPYRTTIGEAVTVPAGLYLSVVHGQNIPPHSEGSLPYITHCPVDKAKPDGGDRVCTIAYTDTALYTFQPQLISLPGLSADGNGWVNHMATFCKWESEPRYASLALQKELKSCEGAASFVFHVTATDPKQNDKVVFEKVVTMTFGKAETQTVQLFEGIPVGCDVRIVEEYSGAQYTLTSAAATPQAPTNGYESAVCDRESAAIVIHNIKGGVIRVGVPPANGQTDDTATIEAGEIVTAVFVNDLKPGFQPGDNGSVVNSFEVDEYGGWSWTKRRYDAETGNWVDDEPVRIGENSQ